MRMREAQAVLSLALLLAPGALHAQADVAQVGTADSAPTDTVPKKKGGLFGKVKSAAGNKVVKQVAKTAVCTMVPGGQAIAGAIDAAGSSCMPGGLPGAAAQATGLGAGLPGGLTGGAMAGMAFEAGAAAAPAPGGRGAPAGAMGYTPTGDDVGEAEMIACMGLTPEEYRAFADPTHGEARQPTQDEMKRQAKAARKIDLGRYQRCMLQASESGLEH
jgi:hypothetical protein